MWSVHKRIYFSVITRCYRLASHRTDRVLISSRDTSCFGRGKLLTVFGGTRDNRVFSSFLFSFVPVALWWGGSKESADQGGAMYRPSELWRSGKCCFWSGNFMGIFIHFTALYDFVISLFFFYDCRSIFPCRWEYKGEWMILGECFSLETLWSLAIHRLHMWLPRVAPAPASLALP